MKRDWCAEPELEELLIDPILLLVMRSDGVRREDILALAERMRRSNRVGAD